MSYYLLPTTPRSRIFAALSPTLSSCREMAYNELSEEQKSKAYAGFRFFSVSQSYQGFGFLSVKWSVVSYLESKNRFSCSCPEHKTGFRCLCGHIAFVIVALKGWTAENEIIAEAEKTLLDYQRSERAKKLILWADKWLSGHCTNNNI